MNDHPIDEQESSKENSPATADANSGDKTAQPKSAPIPVKASDRVLSVDVLRGLALLGILAMNIVIFGWPMGGYENPEFSGGETPLNTILWAFNSLFFSGKMMSIFSMLFGAGLILMAERAEARGASIRGTYYRRVLWLLLIGLIHAYCIWSGDILVMYALCGLLLYLFRKRSPRTLIIVAVILLVIQSALLLGVSVYAHFVSDIAQQVEADVAAGVESPDWQLQAHEAWNKGMRPFMQPTQEDIEKEIAKYRKGYVDIFLARAPEVFMFQVMGLLMFGLWGVGGRMLLGMALMKLGVFDANRSGKFYQRLALFGYSLGIPLSVIGMIALYGNNYAPPQSPVGTMLFNMGQVPIALGHVSVVMMICKSGLMAGLTRSLAAVGRMALTNYLMQSLICSTLFYGYGVGLFGRVDRLGLWGIVIAVWGLQLVISPIWLKHFRYGPAEWLWRSLTYWKRQPLKNPNAN